MDPLLVGFIEAVRGSPSTCAPVPPGPADDEKVTKGQQPLWLVPVGDVRHRVGAENEIELRLLPILLLQRLESVDRKALSLRSSSILLTENQGLVTVASSVIM